MNFHFNDEEQDILNMLHDFCVKEVAPRAHDVDENEQFPQEAAVAFDDERLPAGFVDFLDELANEGLDLTAFIVDQDIFAFLQAAAVVDK